MKKQMSAPLVGLVLAAVIVLGLLRARAGAAEQPVTLRARYGLAQPRSVTAEKTALLLVDFQQEFLDGGLPLPSADAAIARAAELTAWARRSGLLVVVVKNVASRPGALFAPGGRGSELVPTLAPRDGDLVVQKSLLGAFSRTALDTELKRRGVDTLIVAGFMTHLAVFTTASDATLLGYHVVVAADATATRALPGAADELGVDARLLQRASLDAMADRVADVLPQRAILALSVLSSPRH
jgi:nicotinamidase-related amidase